MGSLLKLQNVIRQMLEAYDLMIVRYLSLIQAWLQEKLHSHRTGVGL